MSGVFLVYDITNHNSFYNICKWLDEIKENIGDDENYKIFLIGNKLDLESKRVISNLDQEKFYKENKILYFETSAKTGHNIEFIFEEMIKSILKTNNNIKNTIIIPKKNNIINNNTEKKINIDNNTKNENKCC